MSRKIKTLSTLALLFCFASTAYAVDDEFYYLLGGGEPVSRAASNRDTTIVLGGSVE